MLAAVPKDCVVIALDVAGQGWSTRELATQLEQWLASGRDVALLVGGQLSGGRVNRWCSGQEAGRPRLGLCWWVVRTGWHRTAWHVPGAAGRCLR